MRISFLQENETDDKTGTNTETHTYTQRCANVDKQVHTTYAETYTVSHNLHISATSLPNVD